MKKKLLVLIAVIVAIAAAASPALASPPEYVEGSWSFIPDYSTFSFGKLAGHNQFASTCDFGYWEGGIAGGSYDYSTAVWHSWDHWNLRATVYIEAEVDGKTGTIEMSVVGLLKNGWWQGQWVIIDASGGLEGLHGQGTWFDPSGDPLPGYKYRIDYEGHVHF